MIGQDRMEDTSLLHWMAWTWPTAAFFIFIFLCLAGMSVWEFYVPGGSPRRQQREKTGWRKDAARPDQ